MTSSSHFPLHGQQQQPQHAATPSNNPTTPNSTDTGLLHAAHAYHRVNSSTTSASTRPPSPAKSPKYGLTFDPESMQQQMEMFVKEEIYDSAQVLGEFLIALAASPSSYGNATLLPQAGASTMSNNQNQHHTANMSPFVTAPCLNRDFHAKSYALFGDLLVGKREYKRAIQYYKKYWKVKVSSNAIAASSDSVLMKLKIAKCWMQLENLQQALETLHSIPTPSRSLSVNLLLGKIYMSENLKQKAEEAYTMALRQNPYALEATLALTELAAAKESSSGSSSSSPLSNNLTTTPSATMDGASNTAFRQREIERFYAKLSTLRTSNKFISRVDAVWMQTLVNAHINAKRGRYRAAMESFDAIDQLFPNNLHCLLHKAKLEMDEEYFHQAHLNFHKARQVDDQNLSFMDAHADCLRRNGARTQLNHLVHDLFETSETHVEAWLAAAYYSDLKGEHDTALQFCERAIMNQRRYAPAHLFRGQLLLALNRPEHALVSFTTACKLSKQLEAYAGMIESYVELCAKGANKYKEAWSTAKMVVKMFPHKAKSYTLMGTVFAIRPENRENARRAFQKALSMEPRNLAAIFGLVDLLCSERNFAHAIDKLITLSEQYAREEVFTKLADVYTMNKQFPEAMTNYHRSLSLNPSSSSALRGLDRLEKLMRGEDPDELSTTMEQLDPEEHDESMEAGEYMVS